MEYKKGDHVKITKPSSGDYLWGTRVGGIYEIVRDPLGGLVEIETRDGSAHSTRLMEIENVVPAKLRVKTTLRDRLDAHGR